jgi:hypothetical protein
LPAVHRKLTAAFVAQVIFEVVIDESHLYHPYVHLAVVQMYSRGSFCPEDLQHVDLWAAGGYAR